jgi:hypothetical protein
MPNTPQEKIRQEIQEDKSPPLIVSSYLNLNTKIVVTERSKEVLKKSLPNQRAVDFIYKGYRRILCLASIGQLPSPCDQDTIYLVRDEKMIIAYWSDSGKLRNESMPIEEAGAYWIPIKEGEPYSELCIAFDNVVYPEATIQEIASLFGCTPNSSIVAPGDPFLFFEKVASFQKGDGRPRIDKNGKAFEEIREGKKQDFYIETPDMQSNGIAHDLASLKLGIGPISKGKGMYGKKLGLSSFVLDEKQNMYVRARSGLNEGTFRGGSIKLNKRYINAFTFYESAKELKVWTETLADGISRTIPARFMKKIGDALRKQMNVDVYIDRRYTPFEVIWLHLNDATKAKLWMRTVMLYAQEKGTLGHLLEFFSWALKEHITLPIDYQMDRNYPEYLKELKDSECGFLMEGIDSCLLNKTALMLAALNGHADNLAFLFGKGASLEKVDATGNTALILAVQNGHMNVVNQLLQIKADVNVQNQQGEHALFIAVNNSHDLIIRTLLDAKADPNVKNNDGATSISAAILKPNNKNIATLLFENKQIQLDQKMAIHLMTSARQNRYDHIASEINLALQGKSRQNNLKIEGLGLFKSSKRRILAKHSSKKANNVSINNTMRMYNGYNKK